MFIAWHTLQTRLKVSVFWIIFQILSLNVFLGKIKDWYSAPIIYYLNCIAGLVKALDFKSLKVGIISGEKTNLIKVDGFHISNATPDNCIMVNDKVVLVRSIIFSAESCVDIEYEAFDGIKLFYEYPLKSTNFGIYYCGPPKFGMSMFTLRRL